MYTLSPEPISVEKYAPGQCAEKILVNNISTKFWTKNISVEFVSVIFNDIRPLPVTVNNKPFY